MLEYQGFQMNIFQKYRALKRFHHMLDEYDDDIANAIKIMTGGNNNDIVSQLSIASDIAQTTINVSGLITSMNTMLDKRFETAVESFKYSNEIGEYISMMDINNVWVTLTAYVKEDYNTVPALTISEAFAKDTNFSMKINRRMQYQLGFTINSLFDMGWV